MTLASSLICSSRRSFVEHHDISKARWVNFCFFCQFDDYLSCQPNSSLTLARKPLKEIWGVYTQLDINLLVVGGGGGDDGGWWVMVVGGMDGGGGGDGG